MIWHNDTQSYRGKTSDGKTIDVTGDEYAEALSDGIRILAGFDDANDVPADLVEKYALEVYKEIDDPNTWQPFVGEIRMWNT